MRSQEAARESLEEGITQKEEVVFQLFLFKEEIVVQPGGRRRGRDCMHVVM